MALVFFRFAQTISGALTGFSVFGSAGASNDVLLETGDYILLETGDKIILE